MGIKSKRLKRREKWRLTQEQDELQIQQRKLRTETDELLRNLILLQDAETKAIVANDEASITLLSAQINTAKEKIRLNDERYKANAEILKNYSEAVKNDREGESSGVKTAVGCITGLGGLALGAIGLKKAYETDMTGELINKKTLDWVTKLPIFRGFGKQ